VTATEQFLSKRQRYQPISLPQSFSDEEMVRDWTLSVSDIEEVEKYRKSFRLFVAIQLCSVRLYGRFLNQVHDLSPHYQLCGAAAGFAAVSGSRSTRA
jgi:hypothetical protein